MNGGKSYRCQLIRTTRGITSPPPIKPRCSTAAICSSSVRLILMADSLDGADDREHRQDDVVHERRGKQPERRRGGDNDGEEPAAPATSESEPATDTHALDGDTTALNQEISGRQSVASTRRH